MTTGIYIHNTTKAEYEVLDDYIQNKDNNSRMVLYQEVGKGFTWYVREINNFKKNFTLKEDLIDK